MAMDAFLRVNQPPPMAEELLQCSECSKSFTSSKALFGHMRCHPERTWRGINPPLPARRLDGDTAMVLLMLAKSRGRRRKRQCRTRITWVDGGAHECTICRRVFPTGQALGGHKRRHWGEAEKAGRLWREQVLDLNEPAPLCEEDMEAACHMMEVVPASMKSIKKMLASGYYPKSLC